jgi:two-component system chemotaxis response regulator CheB
MKIEISVGAEGIMNVGSLTPFTCPECHGVLVQIEEGKITRYRCHTRHAYSRNVLLSEIMLKVDESYWSAMRSLEEATMPLDRMGRDMSERGYDASATLFFERGKTTEEHARRLREMVVAIICGARWEGSKHLPLRYPASKGW